VIVFAKVKFYFFDVGKEQAIQECSILTNGGDATH
jgi:hypothetical protein